MAGGGLKNIRIPYTGGNEYSKPLKKMSKKRFLDIFLRGLEYSFPPV